MITSGLRYVRTRVSNIDYFESEHDILVNSDMATEDHNVQSCHKKVLGIFLLGFMNYRARQYHDSVGD